MSEPPPRPPVQDAAFLSDKNGRGKTPSQKMILNVRKRAGTGKGYVMNAAERLMEYVKYETTSDENSGKHPSSDGQLVFAEHLAEEMRRIGIRDVRLNRYACLFGSIPATPGLEHLAPVGLLAHMDTSSEASGNNVNAQIIRSYNGGILPLGSSGKQLDPEHFPSLNHLIGHTLITTDGTTLLGADDKAGIAEIMTAAERILSSEIPHRKICIGFTPDEEIGEGTDFFDVSDFGAAYAYTVDGGGGGEIEYQNFNAASAQVRITGRSVHPGSAKNVMLNAQKLAMEFHALLPPDESPEKTAGLEGFYHLIHMEGTTGSAVLSYILRDHDAARLEEKKLRMREGADLLNRKYGPGTVKLTLQDSYRNMEEIIRRNPVLIRMAEEAARKAKLSPRILPIRGGTDGAMLSFKGLPCPNLGTGGYNFHGEFEFASATEMEAVVDQLVFLISDRSEVQIVLPDGIPSPLTART